MANWLMVIFTGVDWERFEEQPHLRTKTFREALRKAKISSRRFFYDHPILGCLCICYVDIADDDAGIWGPVK